MDKAKNAAILALACLLAYQSYCGPAPPTDAEARVQELEAALPVIARQRDALRDSLTEERESVAQRRDTLQSVASTADTVFTTSVDTLRVIVTDTTALRVIDQLEESHVVALAAKDSIIAGQDRIIERQDSLLWHWERTDSLQAEINDALHSRIAELEREKWKERGVAGVAGAILCGLLCPR